MTSETDEFWEFYDIASLCHKTNRDMLLKGTGSNRYSGLASGNGPRLVGQFRHKPAQHFKESLPEHHRCVLPEKVTTLTQDQIQ